MSKISLKQIFILGFITHILVALGSIGFHHPDEQYYAIDFALLKLGIFDANNFTWEYNDKIRPWFLPSIFYGIINFLKSLNVNNPFVVSTFLRIISAIVTWFSLYKFSIFSKKFFFSEEKHKLFSLTLFTFCISTYMAVRTSADNWMSAFILLALSTSSYLPLSGLFFGLAFAIKHQAGIIALSFGIWLLVQKKTPLKEWIPFAFTILCGVIIGSLIDTWGYGNFTSTPINYLKVNLISDKISSFGVDPWWYYFKLIAIKMNPLWGIPLLVFSFLYMKRYKESFLTWIFIPYFIFHCLIGHKELRFLLPLLPLAILMAFNYYEFLKPKWGNKYFKFAYAINFFGLLFFILKPAYTPITFYKAIWDLANKSDQNINLTLLKDRKSRYPNFELKYYFPKNVSIIKDNRTNGYLLTTKYSDYLNEISRGECKPIFQSYPSWTFKFNIGNWLSRSNIWVLYKCH